MRKVFIDSDIFVLDPRYPRDVRYQVNQKFLGLVRTGRIKGATSIFNLLEVCGILSFNLSASDLVGLYADFCRRYRIKLLFPADATGQLQYPIETIFGQIQKKQGLGDAQVGYVASRFREHLSHFVSWNAPHFEGRVDLPALRPDEFMS